jgi:hypothetical protein
MTKNKIQKNYFLHRGNNKLDMMMLRTIQSPNNIKTQKSKSGEKTKSKTNEYIIHIQQRKIFCLMVCIEESIRKAKVSK